MHCHRYLPAPLTRREMLLQSAGGFGAVALAALLGERSYGAAATHHSPRAKNVIFLYMDGGPSQIDTFDPKPQLAKEHGRPFKMKVQPTQFDNVGTVLKSPWTFRNYGESGLPVSGMFPHVARHADELCVIRSMTSPFSEHTSANYFLHTGHGQQGRPSMGSWVCYGLGSECDDLPGFIVLNGGLIPPGGLDCFHNGFLPATFQGSVFQEGAEPVADLQRTEPTAAAQRRKLELMRLLDQSALARMGPHDEIESAIANYELAFRMQQAVPDVMDLSQETKSTQQLYGLEDDFENTRIYGRNCLIARRLIERGVRFIELTCPNPGVDRWDQHSGLKEGHEKNARAVDRPIAALLADLKARGLLDETLVVWTGEFGRTPMAQGSDGRDHNPFGFSLWLAGGGAKPGTIYGATDEYGYYAVENKLELHDLHAMMLHLLGIDHTQLTVRFSSRDMRLTDVHGHVVHEIVA
ncbi:MAG: DUF1501 domain-containing protein [Planctomycetaceae bacterium]